MASSSSSELHLFETVPIIFKSFKVLRRGITRGGGRTVGSGIGSSMSRPVISTPYFSDLSNNVFCKLNWPVSLLGTAVDSPSVLTFFLLATKPTVPLGRLRVLVRVVVCGRKVGVLIEAL